MLQAVLLGLNVVPAAAKHVRDVRATERSVKRIAAIILGFTLEAQGKCDDEQSRVRGGRERRRSADLSGTAGVKSNEKMTLCSLFLTVAYLSETAKRQTSSEKN